MWAYTTRPSARAARNSSISRWRLALTSPSSRSSTRRELARRGLSAIQASRHACGRSNCYRHAPVVQRPGQADHREFHESVDSLPFTRVALVLEMNASLARKDQSGDLPLATRCFRVGFCTNLLGIGTALTPRARFNRNPRVMTSSGPRRADAATDRQRPSAAEVAKIRRFGYATHDDRSVESGLLSIREVLPYQCSGSGQRVRTSRGHQAERSVLIKATTFQLHRSCLTSSPRPRFTSF